MTPTTNFDFNASTETTRTGGLREYDFVPRSELNGTGYMKGYVSVDARIADVLDLHIPDPIFTGMFVLKGVASCRPTSTMAELEYACEALNEVITPGSVILSVCRNQPVLEYVAEVNTDHATLDWVFQSAGLLTEYDERTSEFAVYSNPRYSRPALLGRTRLCNLSSVCEFELEAVREMIDDVVETDCTLRYSNRRVVFDCRMPGMSKFRFGERFDVEVSDDQGNSFHDVLKLNAVCGGMGFLGRDALETAGFAARTPVHVRIKRLLA